MSVARSGGAATQRSPALALLDIARWAPSADNLQPWRIRLLGPQAFVVSTLRPAPHLKHDVDGLNTDLSIGALLETISIGAARIGFAAEMSVQPGAGDEWRVTLRPDPDARPGQLDRFIEQRSVHRGALSTRAVAVAEKAALCASLGQGYDIQWFEGRAARWSVARLLFAAAEVRLTMPEARLVHNEIVDWGVRFSQARIPEAALGVDKGTRIIMRWALRSWPRLRFLNRFLAGTWLPRIQMDLLTGMLCGAHFAIASPHALDSPAQRAEAGRAMQRFWLTATSLGLQLQPEFAPLVFSRYQRNGVDFTAEAACRQQAIAINERFTALAGAERVERVFMFGRLGHGMPMPSRSLRLPIESRIE